MRRRIRLLYVLAGAFVIVVCSLMYLKQLNSDIVILQDAALETSRLKSDVEARQSALQKELNSKNDRDYLIKLARAEGYILEGEIRFVVTNPEVLYDEPETQEETP